VPNSLDKTGYSNNPKEKNRRGTEFRLVFPTMPSLKKLPRKVELIQKEYAHDVLIVTFSTTGDLWFDDIPTGLPLTFSWTQGSNKNEWAGYVSFVSKSVMSQREKTMEVHCVGSSFPLKERAADVFVNKTIPEVASEIARQFGLEYAGDSHPLRFPQLTIAGHSYWEWLREQALRIGYAMYVDKSTLYFNRIDSVIDKAMTSIPVFNAGKTESVFRGTFYDRTMDMFKVMKGDYLETSSIKRATEHTGGMDPLTGNSYLASQSPNQTGTALRSSVSDVLFSEYRTDQVVHSSKAAEWLAEGAAQLSRFNLPAKVRGQGDPRVRPFMPIYVLGTGPLTDGYWIVKDVVHTFQKFGDYTLDMTVVTDGTREDNKTSFRAQHPTSISTININERLANPMGNINKKLVLKETKKDIVTSAQGFIKSPKYWTSGVN